MDKDFLTFMGNHWVLVENDVVIVGLNDEGVEYADTASEVKLPQEDDEVVAEEIIGEIETEDGPINLYSPVDGKIVEINTTVVESPELIKEDPYGEGWLFKVEPKNIEALSRLSVDLQSDE
ncbi:MAG: glycine cleavage system protein H [Pseudomonadota bacterium]|nr:glycine cleavage system protein H [Pseudomonadota bacterium]